MFRLQNRVLATFVLAAHRACRKRPIKNGWPSNLIINEGFFEDLLQGIADPKRAYVLTVHRIKV